MKESEETVAERRVRKRVEFWASSMDALLQAFLDSASKSDRLGTALAAARLAQLGTCLEEEYFYTANQLVESQDEADMCSKVAEQVAAMATKDAESHKRAMSNARGDGNDDTDGSPLN